MYLENETIIMNATHTPLCALTDTRFYDFEFRATNKSTPKHAECLCKKPLDLNYIAINAGMCDSNRMPHTHTHTHTIKF